MLLQMEDLRYVSIAARVSTYFAGLWVRPRHTSVKRQTNRCKAYSLLQQEKAKHNLHCTMHLSKSNRRVEEDSKISLTKICC